MQPLSRILLPIDFSDRSAAAARCAAALARQFGSEILLLHIVTPLQYEFGALEIGGSMLTELYRGRAQQASAELESFAPAELAGLPVRRLTLEGEPAAKIVELALAEHADLILMPTHGYGTFRRFILGSNTAKVLHDADCPVWTGVHMEQIPTAPPSPFRNILCGVDLGPQSQKALNWAAILARGFGARLALIHAALPDPGAGESPEVSWRTDMREAAEEGLRSLQRQVGVEADVLVETGEPAKAICAAAQRIQANVVVIGRGSAAGVFGRLRTNAYAIIRQSPCPVASV